MLPIALIMMLAAVGMPEPSDLAGLVRTEDYPKAAIQANAQGRTIVRAAVGRDGKPTACRVIKSSRSAALDAATCEIVLARGHFVETAKRYRGKPFEIKISINWRLAETSPTPFDVDMERIIYSLKDGQISGCRSEVAGWRPPDPELCTRFRRDAEGKLASIPEESTISGRDLVFERVRIPGDHRTDSGVGEANGEVLMARNSVVLTIDTAGKVTQCEGGEQGWQTAEEMVQWCREAQTERLSPLAKDADNRGPRLLTRIVADYFRPVEAK